MKRLFIAALLFFPSLVFATDPIPKSQSELSNLPPLAVLPIVPVCSSGTAYTGNVNAVSKTIQYTDSGKATISYISVLGTDGNTYRLTPSFAATSDTFGCYIKQ